MTMLQRALAISSALFLVLAVPVQAQGPSGTLHGQVVDQSGAGVPGVTVTATNPATSETRTAVTGPEGFYRLAALPLGTYGLTYQLEGFKTFTRTSVLVEAAVPRAVNVTLEVGGLSEVVRVEGGSPILNVSTDRFAAAWQRGDRLCSLLDAKLHSLAHRHVRRERGSSAGRQQRYRIAIPFGQRDEDDQQQRPVQRHRHHQHAVESGDTR